MNAPPFQTLHVPPRPHWTEPVSREGTFARREKFQKAGWRPPNHKLKTKRAIAYAKRVWDRYCKHIGVNADQHLLESGPSGWPQIASQNREGLSITRAMRPRISAVEPDGLLSADGTRLPADEIVFATGYQNMCTQARLLFGNKVADRLRDVWGFDEEGEWRTMWRQSGHPGFWFMGGNLAMSRYFGRFLALQIKALEEGLMNYVVV